MSSAVLKSAARFMFLTVLALCLVFSGTAWGAGLTAVMLEEYSNGDDIPASKVVRGQLFFVVADVANNVTHMTVEYFNGDSANPGATLTPVVGMPAANYNNTIVPMSMGNPPYYFPVTVPDAFGTGFLHIRATGRVGAAGNNVFDETAVVEVLPHDQLHISPSTLLIPYDATALQNWGTNVDELTYMYVSGWNAIDEDEASEWKIFSVKKDGVPMTGDEFTIFKEFFTFSYNTANPNNIPLPFTLCAVWPNRGGRLEVGYYEITIEAYGEGTPRTAGYVFPKAVFTLDVGGFAAHGYDPNNPGTGNTGNTGETGGNVYLTENHYHNSKSSGCNMANLVSMALLLVIPMFFRRNKK